MGDLDRRHRMGIVWPASNSSNFGLPSTLQFWHRESRGPLYFAMFVFTHEALWKAIPWDSISPWRFFMGREQCGIGKVAAISRVVFIDVFHPHRALRRNMSSLSCQCRLAINEWRSDLDLILIFTFIKSINDKSIRLA